MSDKDTVAPEWVAAAQVYATLALAAATKGLWRDGGAVDAEGDYLVFQEQAEMALSIAHASLAREVAG